MSAARWWRVVDAWRHLAPIILLLAAPALAQGLQPTSTTIACAAASVSTATFRAGPIVALLRTGLAPAGWPDCVYAASGTAHLRNDQRQHFLIRAARVTVLLERPRIAEGLNRRPANRLSACSCKYRSHVRHRRRSPGRFLAMSFAMPHHGSEKGPITRIAMPTLEQKGRLGIGMAAPGVAVVRTDVNWGMSTSGPTPLVVLLDD